MEKKETKGMIETDVDKLIEVLKEKEKMPLVEVAKKLNISKEVLQRWVDFLVEEQILGIEYKFTTPYIYLNTEAMRSPVMNIEETEMEAEELSFENFKNQFIEKIPKGLSEKSSVLNVETLWKNHLWEILKKKYNFFINEINKRNLAHPEDLWKEYKNRVLSLSKKK